ncbi:hypothetical protein cypCar_00037504 [Cyprinus carpio]|nr:hypothetical protein cypCar_00037504 [Cyprinus carpio]
MRLAAVPLTATGVSNGEENLLAILKRRWWKYMILGLIDIEANYLVIKAYQYTTLTSVQVYDYVYDTKENKTLTVIKFIPLRATGDCSVSDQTVEPDTPADFQCIPQLLDCFVIPVVLLLSWFFLLVRYKVLHFVGVGVCLLGMGCMVGADVLVGRQQGLGKSSPIHDAAVHPE